MSNFAPYQDIDPSAERALSPPPRNRPTSPPLASPRAASPRNSFQASRNASNNIAGVISPNRIASPPLGNSGGFGSRREEMDPFETRLGIRMDYEACLAYLALPPAGPVVLLVFEHKSDYVRYHAWQSALLFAFIFVLHILFSWTAVISWMLFAVDLLLIGWLTYRAYKDAETLDRYHVPFFGSLASQIVDDE
ncbi:hypothetical protein NA57DRAFT_77241 [Rhizodiscina lignyota]|uniref:Uncharacterized protein n=1 Tax=Rhizodiscina lignyota TaxID=1504668 RepID=A0A9P4IEZ6_9PEZI|nr:hypothetical protein NA57DRAFT_77241 [Rhizodiscina lignyota]